MSVECLAFDELMEARMIDFRRRRKAFVKQIWRTIQRYLFFIFIESRRGAFFRPKKSEIA